MIIIRRCANTPIVLFILTAGMTLFLSCSDRKVTDGVRSVSAFDNAVHEPQGLIELRLERLPNMTCDTLAANTYLGPLDEDSIELFEYRGGRYYHPVNLSHRCFQFIGTYKHTGDIKHLQRAEKYARKLMSLLDDFGEASYIPYHFDFAVHGDSRLLMEAPWYSGMAQGEMMCVLVRLHELTGQQDYLAAAERMFQSFLRFRGDFDVWTVRLDEDGYYWVEEYPHHEAPGMTLNGYMAGLFGIYDYCRVTHDPRARRIWDMSITTLKHYLPAFLREGERSYYCLGHHAPTNGFYHKLHIWLCDWLFTMTGDVYFRDVSLRLISDARMKPGAPPLKIE